MRRGVRGDIHGVKEGRGSPILTHLFAGDCFLFCRTDDTQAKIIKDILNTYDKCSG